MFHVTLTGAWKSPSIVFKGCWQNITKWNFNNCPVMMQDPYDSYSIVLRRLAVWASLISLKQDIQQLALALAVHPSFSRQNKYLIKRGNRQHTCTSHCCKHFIRKAINSQDRHSAAKVLNLFNQPKVLLRTHDLSFTHRHKHADKILIQLPK